MASVPVVTLYPNAVVPKIDIANPYASDPASAERGMKYVSQFNCVGCHTPNGAGGMGPSLSMGDFKYGGTAALRTEQVPAEYTQTADPWSHTQPFGFGQKPNTDVPPELKSKPPTPVGPSQ